MDRIIRLWGVSPATLCAVRTGSSTCGLGSISDFAFPLPFPFLLFLSMKASSPHEGLGHRDSRCSCGTCSREHGDGGGQKWHSRGRSGRGHQGCLSHCRILHCRLWNGCFPRRI
ncbi:hypothetical protein L210DRAFT_272580 [Boletus edulis BED1]|uniref:Uncharacterized protein n=1 Tax=Boletus edulis BED1 TaxID=1328754 RepID=A0AAD4C6T0_BOLED|nr:hypothetical protein L210DRAFT_272580 [Boletus edulis BED1]